MIPQPMLLVVLSNRSRKFPIPLAEVDPLQSGRVGLVGATVEHVLTLSDLPQIGEAIVSSATVDVIELIRRPSAMNDNPTNYMGPLNVLLECADEISAYDVGKRDFS